ncbi:MAG TPA: PDZ domain-containing protein [Terriglobales bacterium]|nr:PDZ domain-containing protein [Terriglobales bacterium]
MRTAAAFFVLTLALCLSGPTAPSTAQACSAPTYLGICNPYVPGTLISVNDGGGISVAGTWHKGPAEKAGVCSGDQIVAVNGLSADMGWAKLQHELISTTPTPVHLKIKRGQEVLDFTVPRVRETTLAALSGEKFIRPPSIWADVVVTVPDYVTEQDVKSVESFRQRLLTNVGFTVVSGMEVPQDMPDEPVQRLRDALKHSDRILGTIGRTHNGYSAGFSVILFKQPSEALVGSILPGSPAGTAGLWVGDEVVAVNGQLIATIGLDILQSQLSKPGKIVVQVRREKALLNLEMETIPVAGIFASRPDRQLPDFAKPTATTYITGITLLWDEKRHRAMADYLDPPCPAFAAHLHPGSEILEINGKAVSGMSRNEVAKQLSPTDAKPILLTVKRAGKQHTLHVVPVLYKDALASIGRKLAEFGPSPISCPD